MIFAYGLSDRKNIFTSTYNKFFKKILKYNFYYHISITYPFSYFFIKKKISNKKNIIAKTIADNHLNFSLSIKNTLKKFNLESIKIIQIINLPVRDIKKSRTMSNLDITELEKIIGKAYVQIYYSDDKDLVIKLLKIFDGVVFYANYPNVYLKKNIFELIKKKNKPIIQLAVFGSLDKKRLKIIDTINWNIKCMSFLSHYFRKKIIMIGRTNKITRAQRIFEFINYKNKIIMSKKIKFKNNYIFQDKSSKYIHDMKYTSFSFEIKNLLIDYLRK